MCVIVSVISGSQVFRFIFEVWSWIAAFSQGLWRLTFTYHGLCDFWFWACELILLWPLLLFPFVNLTWSNVSLQSNFGFDHPGFAQHQDHFLIATLSAWDIFVLWAQCKFMSDTKFQGHSFDSLWEFLPSTQSHRKGKLSFPWWQVQLVLLSLIPLALILIYYIRIS